ncbi:hypothetical protein NQZ68_027315 [Dissostichus eleginoides]|nr:hypothetical protein NQZ68_027315 [Dissostichus eleginoides]
MDVPVKAQRESVDVASAAAPDGGYAWFILLSSFLAFGLTFGVIKAFGFGLFAVLGFFAQALFLVPYAHGKGIEEYQTAALVSISAALDLFGMLFFGWLANLRLVETVQQLIASVILLGTVLLLCLPASSFSELAAFSAAYGLVYGATVAIHITVLSEVVGVNRLGSALGFFMLIRSSGGMLGPPIAGSATPARKCPVCEHSQQ